ERHLAKVEVASSNLVTRSKKVLWLNGSLRKIHKAPSNLPVKGLLEGVFIFYKLFFLENICF
ncbi:MAG: hypothetical protein RSF33_00725, partial [Hydrogenoanaerobacterium sp.]